MMLSALTDGPRHLLLKTNCDSLHFCFFTAMTSTKNDVTIKNLGDYHSFQWLPKVPEFSTSLQK